MRTSLVGIYPGTFDPITNGHRDIIKKAIMVVDELIIAVATDLADKKPAFSAADRVTMIDNSLADIISTLPEHKKIKAVSFSGLLVDFVKASSSQLIIRGLRAVSDFEYEFQLASMNYKIAPEIQTIFLPATDKSQYIASRIVKEIARLGGDVSGFVSPYVNNCLVKYFSATATSSNCNM